MLTEQNLNDHVSFNFPVYHNEDSLNTSLDKMYTDPRAVAILYGCGPYPTTENFRTAIEKTLKTHDYDSTITIREMLDFDIAEQMINGDDLTELTGDDYAPYAEIDDYRLELCAYRCNRNGFNVSEEMLDKAYLKFIYEVAKMKAAHYDRVGLAELMADDAEKHTVTDEDLDNIFGKN